MQWCVVWKAYGRNTRRELSSSVGVSFCKFQVWSKRYQVNFQVLKKNNLLSNAYNPHWSFVKELTSLVLLWVKMYILGSVGQRLRKNVFCLHTIRKHKPVGILRKKVNNLFCCLQILWQMACNQNTRCLF